MQFVARYSAVTEVTFGGQILNWNRSSLRTRTTSATAAVAALVCIGGSVLFLAFMGSKETNDAQARVTAEWNRVLPLIIVGRLPRVLPYAKDDMGEAIQVVNASGQVVSATRQLIDQPPIALLRRTDTEIRTQRTLCPPAGLKGCRTIVTFKVYQPEGIWLIDVVVPGVPWYGNSTVLFLVIGACLLMIVMMAAGTFRAVTKTLAPVDDIRTELAEITATGLDRRVPVPEHREIRMLAETVNETLDRLEGAYTQLRHFTSDASHDLRSPITAVRTQVEEALMYPDDTDWPRTANAVLSGVERLQAIVTDLLALARLDAGVPFTRDSTDLAQLVGAELDRRTFKAKVIRNLRRGVIIQCDRLRMSRLLTNLLDNAERHATSQITVIVRPEESAAVLEVIDDGAGIAPELREVVFKRFVRLEASRSRDTGGTGLGLAIARQIAHTHQGTLTIQDCERAARFVLRLPRDCRNNGVTPEM
jgi:signal transduction histidine kinase